MAWRLLSFVTILAGAALVLIPTYQTIGWIGSDIAAGRPFDGRDMTVGLHQQEAFDELAAVIGGTEVTRINFYDSYVIATAPTTPGSRTVDQFTWRYGSAHRDGPNYSQPDDLRAELFDAGDIDMSVVGRVTQQSIADANLGGLDGVYPLIARTGEDGAPQISISLSGEYYEAYYSYTIDGELIQRSGSAFE